MCIAHASNMIRDVMHFKLFVPRSVLAGSDGRTKEWCREHVEHRVRGPRRADDRTVDARRPRRPPSSPVVRHSRGQARTGQAIAMTIKSDRSHTVINENRSKLKYIGHAHVDTMH